MVHIIVCTKIIMDPEIPLSIFKIDQDAKKPAPPVGMPPVFSPFDLNALEAALRIKDQNGDDCKVTVLSLGKNLSKALLKKLLAMGADEAVVVEDAQFEHLDPFNTANGLVKAIEKLGNFDLIFTGRQAADWDAGIVWAGIAHQLGIPAITIARKADLVETSVVVERCVSDGIEILEADLPVLVTFSSEVGEPRFASLKAMMQASKKPITSMTASDIGFEFTGQMTYESLNEPSIATVDCQYIDGGSDDEKGRQLARVLREQGLIGP